MCHNESKYSIAGWSLSGSGKPLWVSLLAYSRSHDASFPLLFCPFHMCLETACLGQEFQFAGKGGGNSSWATFPFSSKSQLFSLLPLALSLYLWPNNLWFTPEQTEHFGDLIVKSFTKREMWEYGRGTTSSSSLLKFCLGLVRCC